jgi:5-methylcytosine-specific restriction protein B
MNLHESLSNFFQSALRGEGNPTASKHPRKRAMDDLQSTLKTLPFVQNRSELKVMSSVGKGQAATIPWVAILHSNRASSVHDGVYIVYLFSKDFKAVHLTLLQGVTAYRKLHKKRKAIEILSKASDVLRSDFKSVAQYNFQMNGELDLRAPRYELAELYAASTITHKKYLANNLPNDEQLTQDLALLIEAYCQDTMEPNTKMAHDTEIVDHVIATLQAEGLHFTHEQVADFYLCLKTKPFVLLAGISGTGKTLLPRRFAKACGFTPDLISVRPDWSDPSDLLGYRNLQGQYVPGALIPPLIRAWQYTENPVFVILDEMNLARVEHYFADVLSVLETRERLDGVVRTTPLLRLDPEVDVLGDPALTGALRALLAGHSGALGIPPNLTFIGTVNMDESTHPFSKKVLDRAMTMEFTEVDLSLPPGAGQAPTARTIASETLAADVLSLAEIWSADGFREALATLSAINEVLKLRSLHVGYRVRDELCIYLHNSRRAGLLDETTALDLAIHHKVLPRVQGGDEVEEILSRLLALCEARSLTRCCAKLKEMQERLKDSSYTSFWS